MPLTHTHTHKTLSSKKSQSAMEYLMTYGWAILIIAVVLGVLFQLGIFSGSALAPKAQPGSCQVQRLLGQVSLEGLCQGQLPQFVGQFTTTATGNVLVSSLSSFNTQTFSLSFWIRLTSVPPGYIRIVDKGEGDATGAWTCGTDSGLTRIICGVYDGSAKHEWFSQTLSNSAWYYVVMTYNGAAVGGYLNGTFKGWVFGNMVSDAVPIAIGSDAALGGISFNGLIANVQLYNATLSANEVQGLYQEGIGGAPVRIQNLVGWWPLNGNPNDYSGNNYNGKIMGTALDFNGTWTSSYSPP